MKTKMQVHIEAIEIVNKPGKFVIASQFVSGGLITTDDNKGGGYTQEQSDLEIAKRLKQFKGCPNCQ